MKHLLNTALAVVLLLLSYSTMNSQTKFLVSEYKNISGNTTGEWIELLVIEDKVDIVGYYLRDNSGTGDWMGGIVFKDVSLWRNLRKGTSILINTRGFDAKDVDPSDGFIKVDAENPVYFDKRIENAIAWENVLNFNQSTECVHLLDNNDIHHHALAQSTFPVLTAIAILPAPKVVHQDNSNASAVRFYGYGGGAYNQATGTDSTTNISLGETPGYANVGPTPALLNINQLYWRALRQPQWTSPSLSISFVGNGIRLFWNNAADIYPSDKYQGYTITRHLKTESASAGIPEDSRVYPVGTNIGSAMVIANVQGSDITEFIDNNYDCGKDYVYRVFAFRYKNTGDETDNMPTRGRGRSYNETSFAQNEIKTPATGTATINLVNTANSVFCVGDVVKFAATVPNGNYTYQWLVNNSVYSNDKKDTIEINIAKGIFRVSLKLINELNCSSISNEIVYEGVDRPNPYLARIQGKNETRYNKDETVYLCFGDSLMLNGTAGIISPDVKITWYKDGSVWKQNVNVVKIVENGEYYFIASNKNDCQSQSFKITVLFREYDYKIEPSLLTYAVDMADTFLDQTITITNNANSELLITSDMLIVPTGAGYSIIDPTIFPLVLGAKVQTTITLRFTPPALGLYRGRFIIKTPCGSKFTDLVGYKDAGKPSLSAGDPIINLGSYLYCDLPAKIDTTLIITALGNENIILGTPINLNDTDFLLKTDEMPASVNPFESFSITVELLNYSIGIHKTSISIPYLASISGTVYDTLHLIVNVNIYEPTVSTLEIYDSGTITGCEPAVSFQLAITNTSETEVTFTEQFNDSRLNISNLPITILPGETAELNVKLTMTMQDEDFIANLPYEPCGSVKSIRFKAHYEGMIFNLSDVSADFGNLFTCQNDKSKEMTLTINNYQTDAKIKAIAISNPADYSIEGLSVGQQLSPSNDFAIKIISNEAKNYNGQIELTFEPCDNTITIPITANVQDLNYSFSGITNNVVDFGTVDFGATETKIFSFTNNSSESIVINHSDIATFPFLLLSPNIVSFPLTVPPAGKVDFIYAFAPKEYDLDITYDITLTITNPCNIPNTIRMIAKSEKQKLSINARLELPALKITAQPGQPAKALISLFNKGVEPIKNSGITKLSFNLNYNAKLLYPKSIVAKGSMIGNTNAISINETEAGKLLVSIEPKDMSLFNDGAFVEVEFMALLGNALKTNITISHVEVESPNDVTLETTLAEFELIGECNLAGRLMQIGSEAGIIPNSNQSNGSFDLHINHIVDGRLNVSVFDALGNKVAELFDGYKKSGLHLLNFEASKFASGVYIINMTYEGGSATEKIVVGR